MRDQGADVVLRAEPNAKRTRTKPDANKILESARREFSRRGYADTSLRQLMSAARVSTTAFYTRFGSKEEVLRALVQRLLDAIDQAARQELAQARNLKDGFRRGVNALVHVIGPQRELVHIALTQAAASPVVNTALGARYATLASLLAMQIQSLEGVDVDPDALAWSLVGALHMQVLRWAAYEQLATDELPKALLAVAEAHLPALRTNKTRKR